MSNYNFSTLNDKEFEQISKDLLNAKFNLELQNFKVGKDKGTDLRFSTSKNNNSIVVQVKHYIGSAFAQLKYTLSSKELTKIQNLKPDRYIVVTSLSLSASQKDEIKTILSPFVLTSNDVIGQEDLNGYLSDFKEIEKNYFKLWFSSTNVFNSIINNAVEGRTKYLLEQIKSKIPFYVVTKKLDEAIKILLKEKLLLITGQPGIGKTTLAEIILFERAKNGYKIYKVENISEAENVISLNDEDKQIFYFDDFLGANYFEIINAQKTETQLTSFVERIKNTPNKHLILTTRTVILSYAFEKYEKISHSKLANQQFEIKLNDYTKYEKALILYNHIYFKGIREDLFDCILNDKFYKNIILHKNYTPRIIEFITDNSKIENLNSETYPQFVLNNLNNPKEIWRYSFNNQIDYLDRCLLLTLFTFENSANESSLVYAFEKRLEYEKSEHNQIINTNQFNESVRILLNGFITSKLYNNDPPVRQFVFINPSLADFFIGHVSESFPERKSIISSLKYVEQLRRFNPEKQLLGLEKELQAIIRDKITNSQLEIQESNSKYFTKNKEHVILMEILCKYCQLVNVDNILLKHLNQLSYSESWSDIFQQIEYVLLNLNDAPQTFDFIKKNFKQIIEKMMCSISNYYDASKIPVLFEKYEHNYDEYSETEEGFENLVGVIESVLESSEQSIKSDRKEDVKNIDEVTQYYDEIYLLEQELKDELFPNSFCDHDFGYDMDKSYWEDIIEENLFKEEKYNAMKEDYDEDFYRESRFEAFNEDNAVDDLFIKSD